MIKEIIMKSSYVRIVITLSVFFVLISVLPAFSAKVASDVKSAQATSGIDFKEGFIKISVVNEDLQNVIDQVAGKTGIRIIASSAINEKITLDLDFMPLEKGLKQLLGDRSHVLLYSGDGSGNTRISRVLILPRSKGGSMEGLKNFEAGKNLDQAAKINELLDLDQQILKTVTQGMTLDESEINAVFNNAMEQLKGSDSDGLKTLALQIERAMIKPSDELTLRNKIREARESNPSVTDSDGINNKKY